VKNILVFVALLCAFFSLSAFAVELQGLTVDGNYWFGAGKSILSIDNVPVDSKHNSVNVAASASFAPGIVLGLDYTYGKHSKFSQEGEIYKMLEEVEYSEAYQLFSATLGYTAALLPGLYATASLGLGAYKQTGSGKIEAESSDRIVFALETLRPQIGLAAQYQVTPDFSLRGNVATFLGNGGEFSVDFSDGYGDSSKIDLKLLRWQIEGKYLLKAGWEAVAGYRAWDSHVSDDDYGINLGATGSYFGVRYSY